MKYYIQYDTDTYHGQTLAMPGLSHLNPDAIGPKPHLFDTQREAEQAAIAHGMSCYSIRSQP